MIPIAALPAAGGVAGFGASSLLTHLSDALSAPRRLAWSALGLPEQGSQLSANIFGGDEGDTHNQLLGMIAEMVGDPLNLATGALGHFAGRAVGSAATRAAEFVGGKAALQSELQGANRVGKLAQTGLRDAGLYDDLALKSAEQARPVTLPSHAGVGYHPAVLGELPELQQIAPRTYNRVDPAVASMIDDAGLGSRLPQGGVQVLGKPGFATGRGGVLKPAGEGIGGLPHGYLDTLTGPGAGDVAIGRGAVPPSAVDMARPEQLGKIGSMLPGNDALGLGRQLGGAADLLDMAPEQAMSAAGQHAHQVRSRLADLINSFHSSASPLEKWLVNRGYGT